MQLISNNDIFKPWKVSLKDIIENEYDGFNIEATKSDILKITKKWKFNWSEIFCNDRLTFKIVKDNTIQGLLKLEWENDEYIIMKNIEVSPSNFESKGVYSNIVKLLISFACYQTFKLNSGGYSGYLAFTSKGNLIEYYMQKYDTELIFRERMIIAPLSAL